MMGTSNTFVQSKLGQLDIKQKPSVRLRLLSIVRGLIKEPLVHFLLLGMLLFLYYQWKGGAGPDSTRIIITKADVDHLIMGFVSTWNRQPTQAELKGLLDDYVKEEIATREALAMGLDRNDIIIRRRLRQKLEFLADDNTSVNAPTDAQLQAWLNSHPDAFRGEPLIAFMQVYVNSSARGQGAEREANRLLELLRGGGSHASTASLGDASLLPSQQPLSPVSEIAKTFGDKFSQEIEKLSPGQWNGPVESSFGLHLVLVQQKVSATAPKLAEIRPLVEQEVIQERRKAQLDAMYQGLLSKYVVTIDSHQRDGQSKPQAGAGR